MAEVLHNPEEDSDLKGLSELTPEQKNMLMAYLLAQLAEDGIIDPLDAFMKLEEMFPSPDIDSDSLPNQSKV